MNAAATRVMADGERAGGVTKLLSQQVGKLSRSLGFEFKARLPERPRLQHDLERLTFFNGTVYELHNGQPSKEYMQLPYVEVVRKLSLKETDDERCEYRFELNTSTDPVWRWFFRKLPSGVSVQFQNNVMVLTCIPANLESCYHKVRDSLRQANVWYAEEREQLIQTVIAKDDDRLAAEEMEENRKMGLRWQFENLQI